jgi:hypothetical protein
VFFEHQLPAWQDSESPDVEGLFCHVGRQTREGKTFASATFEHLPGTEGLASDFTRVYVGD